MTAEKKISRPDSEPPKAMLAVYNYLHNKQTDKALEVKRCQAMHRGECNYRISKNADISTVCWQSARGFYSKANRIDHGSSINARCKLAVEFYSRMRYTVFERS